VTLIDRLRALAESVPPGGSVTIPRDWLAGELSSTDVGPIAPAKEASERLLTADEAATRLGVSVRWVYDHAHEIGVRRLSRRCVRFAEAAVDRRAQRGGRVT